jgi:hypothetical protein
MERNNKPPPEPVTSLTCATSMALLGPHAHYGVAFDLKPDGRLAVLPLFVRAARGYRVDLQNGDNYGVPTGDAWLAALATELRGGLRCREPISQAVALAYCDRAAAYLEDGEAPLPDWEEARTLVKQKLAEFRSFVAKEGALHRQYLW